MLTNDLIVCSINAIQTLNGLVSLDGDPVMAPELADYPTSLDTMGFPTALTQINTQSAINLKCSNTAIALSVTLSVYVESFAQGFYGKVLEKVYRLADEFRYVYLTASNFLYDDLDDRVLIDESDRKIYIASSTPLQFTGYTILEYPARSGSFYHGFELGQMDVVAKDGGGC